MRELTIGKNDAGQRVDRFVSKALPLLPPALLQKYIRLKRIKVNGGRAQRDQRLREGDVLQLYINDEFFDKPREDNLFLTLFRPSLDIVYEDENLMLLNKRPGLVVHADETEKVNTLINHIQAYLYQKREWNPRWENAFTPALCNRIDRNTGGIVIAAKNAEKAAKLNDAFQGKADAKSVAAGAAAEAVKTDVPAAVAVEATTASDLNGKRVLVLCQGGGTSGLLANALAKAAKERGINLETAAEAYGNHVDMLPDFDLVVLAPQAASYLADLQKDCERVGNKCVACRGKQYIELSQNGDKSLAFVSEQLSK